jgi:hypothetical protein
MQTQTTQCGLLTASNTLCVALQKTTRPPSTYKVTSVRKELPLPDDKDSIGAQPEEFPLILPVVPCLVFLLCLFESAKGRIWHGLFMAVLHRPFRAQKAHVLFVVVCLFS